MSDVAYRSEVRIKCIKGPVRNSVLPAEPEPFIFGVRGAVARALPRSRNPRYKRSIALSPLRQGDWRFPGEPLRP
jgi:hypothetical protein